MRSAILAALLLVSLPAAAGAAIVRVEEKAAFTNEAHLVFAASPGESNTVAIAATREGESLKLKVLDRGAPLAPGAGCAGDGATGTPVTCTIHRPKAPDLMVIGGKVVTAISETAWEDEFVVDLGDGTNSLDASSLAGEFSERIDMAVTAGDGNDTIVTGSGWDTIDPGRGTDSVHTGGGADRVYATETADGPDLYDLGTDTGKVDYGRRTEPVYFDGRAAGGQGEDDVVLSPDPYIVGGSGDDVLRAANPGGEKLDGGPGDDRLWGGIGPDQLLGGTGDDVVHGGDGKDILSGDPGDDVLDGGKGDDRLFDRWTRNEPDLATPGLAPVGPSGDDLAIGRSGADWLKLGAGADRGLGGIGADRIFGEGGPDLIAGGAGEDLLDCGASRDTARVDDRDGPIRSCEVVRGLPMRHRR